jgi:hypothetical protein
MVVGAVRGGKILDVVSKLAMPDFHCTALVIQYLFPAGGLTLLQKMCNVDDNDQSRITTSQEGKVPWNRLQRAVAEGKGGFKLADLYQLAWMSAHSSQRRLKIGNDGTDPHTISLVNHTDTLYSALFTGRKNGHLEFYMR